jgi:hypothetical protein
MLLLQAVQSVQQTGSSSSSSYLWPTLIAIAAVILNIISLSIQTLFNQRTQNHNQRVLADKKIEEKRKEIYKKLDDFYGPFQQYLSKSLELYRIFSANKPEGFRALTYLLEPNQLYNGIKIDLTSNDKAIFSEIISVGKQLEKLILTKAGLIDDPSLRQDSSSASNTVPTDVSGLQKNGLLALLTTHLFVIRLAYEGKLTGQLDVYKNYVFPRNLPLLIENNIKRLNNELDELNRL